MKSIDSLRIRLNNPEDISFYDYSTLALRVIEASDLLEVDLSDIKDQLVNNLRGRGNDLAEEKVFSSFPPISIDGEKFQAEYTTIRNRMRKSLASDNELIPDSYYVPERVKEFRFLVNDKMDAIRRNRSFALRLDIPRMIDLFFRCNPAQMDDYRRIFQNVYSSYDSSISLFNIDKPYLEQLLGGIQEGLTYQSIGKIQKFQCKWFIEDLQEILRKL